MLQVQIPCDSSAIFMYRFFWIEFVRLFSFACVEFRSNSALGLQDAGVLGISCSICVYCLGLGGSRAELLPAIQSCIGLHRCEYRHLFSAGKCYLEVQQRLPFENRRMSQRLRTWSSFRDALIPASSSLPRHRRGLEFSLFTVLPFILSCKY